MDTEAAIAFVEDHKRAVLATIRSDGTPQMSPVLVGLDEDRRLLVSTRTTALKVTNLTRDPRAHLCVLSDEFFGPWVQLAGDTEIVHLPEAMDLLVDLYRSLSGEHPDWEDYRAAMVRESRCVLRITVDQAGPHRAG